MSRHLLVDFADVQLVLGFDNPLRSFFGQVFFPDRDPGTARGGWPTLSGLGTRRPAATSVEAGDDVQLLCEWAHCRLIEHRALSDAAIERLGLFAILLMHEWDGHATPPLPDCLKGVRW